METFGFATKRPITIKYCDWGGNVDRLESFGLHNLKTHNDFHGCKSCFNLVSTNPLTLELRTMEGWIFLKKEDVIIEGIDGEHYPIERKIFESTYYIGRESQ